MKFDEFKIVLRDLLYEACHSYGEKLKSDLKGEKIYACAIYLGDTWNITVSTREYLEERLEEEKQEKPEFKVPNFYLEMAGDEWKYIGKHDDIFTLVNKKLRELDAIYYGETMFDDANMGINQIKVSIDQMIITIIVDVMNHLKQDGLFNDVGFEEDMYLGVHISDPSEKELIMMIEVSKKLNSDYWQSQLKKYVNY